MTQRILIIGITGGAGCEMASAALDSGYDVRAMHRHPGALDLNPAIDVVAGDAMVTADVVRAAGGCDFILHAANPPRYRNWDRTVVKMARNAARAALSVDARLFIPGSIYNFGPDAMPLIREGAEQNPVSAKGRVRVEMERMLKDSGAKVTILRAGDFFGRHAPASWFETVMRTPGKPVRKVIWPGTDAGHAFAYLPDLARTFVRLMQEDARMDRFEDLHFAGHYFANGRDFAVQIAEASGLPASKVKSFPWAATFFAAPFVPLLREIREMRYLWQVDAALDNTRLLERIGEEPHTPIAEALHLSLSSKDAEADDASWSEGSATLFSA
ncbi:NAD(P)H-binding protein [Minwuia sp.]|uniref:NAD(P)H-binding protein n=1 Tax=Minwuia sp. TaxID=2493630 RepID=UPI003A8F2525